MPNDQNQDVYQKIKTSRKHFFDDEKRKISWTVRCWSKMGGPIRETESGF